MQDLTAFHGMQDLTWVGSLFHGIVAASIPVMVPVTVGLWLLARPDGSRKWKLAATGALASTGVALLINRLISSLWFRERPFLAHRIAHPWINSRDASFPSDHASASFAIAFAVMMIDPLAGALFLILAAVVAVGRLFIGPHYPGHVVAGVGVGLLSVARAKPRGLERRPSRGAAWSSIVVRHERHEEI